MSSDSAASDVVQQRITEGLTRRRSRAAVRQLVRVTPWAAGVLVLFALAGRLFAWPPTVTWTAIGVVAVAAAGWFVWMRRPVRATDRSAASLDADASLGGELRSAFWFAAQHESSPWSAFHLERAATRLTLVQWADFYPPVRATRAWSITAVLVLVAALATVRVPVRHPVTAVAVTQVTPAVPPMPLEALLPPDVRKRLEDLLAQIEAGKIAAAAANAKLQELREMLSKIDPSIEPELAKLAARSADAPVAEGAKGNAQSLADRAAAAAKSDLPADLREQLKDLASRLANPRVGERADSSAERAATADAGQLSKASAGAEANQASLAQVAVQISREAASDPGNGQMMLAGAGSMGGDSSAGAGGNSGARSG